jgi:hypothetical protein
MNWTKPVLLAASLAAMTLFGPTIGRAAEPEDASTSAAQSAVRDARDQMLNREKSSEVRHAPPKCDEGKAECRGKIENGERDREHDRPH